MEWYLVLKALKTAKKKKRNCTKLTAYMFLNVFFSKYTFSLTFFSI